jgi:hypothetical protein
MNGREQMRRLALLVLAMLASAASSAQWCSGNLIPNGQFERPEGENVVAWNWVGTETPDINSIYLPIQTTGGYEWTGTPLQSSAGGRWQNMFDTVESVLTYALLTPGQWYTLCFEYAAQGIVYVPYNTVYNGPVGVELWVNGQLVLTTPDDSTQFTWESACYSFTTEMATNSFKFRPSGYQYIAIDGACLLQEGAVGMNETKLPLVEIYPNPASNHIVVKGLRIGMDISLVDMSGRNIAINSITDDSEEIRISTDLIQNGFYTIVVSDGQRNIRRKLLVNH